MAEDLSPAEAELLSRRQSHEAAMRRLAEARRLASEARVDRLPPLPGWLGQQLEDHQRQLGVFSEAEGRLARTVGKDVLAAEEAEERARAYYERGVESLPGNEFRQILREAERVGAPEMTSWDWFRSNPSILEATPLTDSQRAEKARLAHVLKRVQKASSARPPHDPFAWSNYSGPGSQQMAELEVLAAEHFGVPGTAYSGNPERRRQLESPYSYRPFNRDEDGNFLPLEGTKEWHRQAYDSYMSDKLPPGGQLSEALRPLAALWGGASRFHDNFASGGAAVAEGRLGDAAKSFAYAMPNLVSPSFHRGGPGMKDDWRTYVKPGEAAMLDVAADLPWWFQRGVYPARRGVPMAGAAEDRIRQQLLELRGRAAKVFHPDAGGSLDAMKRVNAAFDAGDLESLRQMVR